ncbi:alpha/beta fold hydrolase [Actinokineospora inagensis]|uniref:alpha/beta fold hydrolase n=1 Tax=Actinokineospora inagensis TaxID=103730 RepID=UPI00041A4632|nr:alpha/beta fold hydrolase [Actinokineospora inagensis]
MWTKRIAAVALVATAATVVTIGPAAASPPRWTPCGAEGAECGSVQVPLDWAHPNGSRITIALTRLSAADPAHRVGVLLFNPGGPGGSGVELVRDYGKELFPQSLRDRFDLVGFDPRGVGESTPVKCPVAPTDPTISDFPQTKAQYDALVAHNRAVAASCRAATGPLIDHVDTISAARDIDVIRAALGESKISWLGLSYGTMLGATYASLYPSRVRAAVLDGAVDHTLGVRRMVMDETRTTEDVFTRFVAWCQSDTSCAMHGQDVTARYRQLNTTDAVGFTAYGALTSPRAWPMLAEALKSGTGFDAPTDPAYRVITCHDFPTDIHSFPQLQAREAEAARLAPITRGYVEAWDVQVGCIGWPIPPANPWAPTPVNGPKVLVVTGHHDPATPYPWGVALAHQITGSQLLPWNGVGHTAYLEDKATQAQEIAYLTEN